jgi:hypothetical protein
VKPGANLAAVNLQRGEFANEAFTDFSKPENKAAMVAALAQVKAMFGREYPLTIGGERVYTVAKTESLNPSAAGAGDWRVSEGHGGDGQHRGGQGAGGVRALEARAGGGAGGVHLPRGGYFAQAAVRIECLAELRNREDLAGSGRGHRRADRFLRILRAGGAAAGRAAKIDAVSRRKQLHEIYSAGRGHRDSAVEFCGGDHGRDDDRGDRHRKHGDRETVERFADDCGDIYRDFVRGGRADGCGELFYRAGEHGGRSFSYECENAIYCVYGIEGSGMRIAEQATKTQPGQVWIKRTVLEMGGKDAIIVDDEADVDAAVEGVALSAFGYQGQKCSACSRAIVSEKFTTNFWASWSSG